MKYYGLAAALAFSLVVLGACLADSTPPIDIEATIQSAVEATLSAQPTNTPVPDMQATLVSAVEATLVAQQNAPTPTTSPSVEPPTVASASDRPYRSYPAPTGYPAFRKYYQMRCYPGCHYGVSAGTPTPHVVHP